jgi:rfaE bifunctional protein kinase chain/domain
MNEQIVLVYGSFHSIHIGHLRLFYYAKSIGDKLVVALKSSSSESVEVFVNSIRETIPIVDMVVEFSDLHELLSRVRPNIVLRGLEFRNKKDADHEIISNSGARVIYSSGKAMQETSVKPKQINRIEIASNFLKAINTSDFDLMKRSLGGGSAVKIKVVGDLIVDEIVDCQIVGLSQEDQLPVSIPIANTRFLGGAGIVAAHCKSLGAQVELVSSIGHDDHGEWAAKKLKSIGVRNRFVDSHGRPTTLKLRYKHNGKSIFRLSHLDSRPRDLEELDEIVETTLADIEVFDALIFSDFSYGMLPTYACRSIIEKARLRNINIVIAADSQTSSQIGNLAKFRNVNLITATEHEARMELKDGELGLSALLHRLGESIGCDNLVLKLGALGLLFSSFNKAGRSPAFEIPAMNLSPVDTSGAGDALLAATTLAHIHLKGEDFRVAALLGAIAAGVQISRIGNLPILLSEMDSQLSMIASLKEGSVQ